jgi:glyoxylase-like metal-dependent hydrolase (beta-lactamase superfamily II)
MRLGIPVAVHLRLFAAGYCTHPEWVTIRGGGRTSVPFPAGLAYVEHPQAGGILIDTGYTSRFFLETSRLPSSIYRWLTPVKLRPEEEAIRQLHAAGIDTADIRTIVLTHFHADHVSGVMDFPHARFMYLRKAYAAVKKLRGLAALKAGFLGGLLPDDFIARSYAWEQDAAVPLPFAAPFDHGYDLLGDGSLFAVELPGHAEGQIGVFLRTETADYFLCADAAWSRAAIHENRPPHPIAGLIMSNRRQYQRTFMKLQELQQAYPELRIVPFHCRASLFEWSQEGGEL